MTAVHIDDTIRSFRPMIRKLVRDRFGGVYSVSYDEMEAEALVATWKAIEEYKPGGAALKTWVWRRAFFRIVQLLRSERVYVTKDSKGKRLQDVQLSSHDDIRIEADRSVEGRDTVDCCLSKLSRRTQDVIRLRMDGYTAAESSQRLGICEDTIVRSMRRARQLVLYSDLAVA